MEEQTAVCGWCGENQRLLEAGDMAGRFYGHIPRGENKRICRGGLKFPANTVTEAAAERVRDAAPRLLFTLTELCDALDAGADSIVIGGLKNQARFAIAAATVRPQT